MPRHCAFGECHSNSKTAGPDIKFLPFPKPWIDLHRAKRWIHLCSRGPAFTVEKVTKDTYVCSLHFNIQPGDSLDLSLIHI